MFQSDLMGIPVAESGGDIAHSASALRGYMRRDYSADPSGQTGFAAPFTIPVFSRQEIKERIEELERTKSRLFDLMQASGIPPLDQKYTSTCWANGTVDGVQVARAAAGKPYVPLSAGSVAGPATNYKNWNGSPAGVGGWGLQAAKWIVKDGIAPQSLWPNSSLNPKNDTEEVRTERQKYRINPDGWLDLPPQQWEPVLTCILLGYSCPMAHNEWGHLTNAISLAIDAKGRINTLVRNSGYGRDKTGHTWLPESFGTPDETLAVRLVT